MVRNALLILLCSMSVVGCSQMPSDSFRYVPIGDSYTEGTGVHPQNAWPVLLSNSLTEEGYDFLLIENLGRAGWTSEDALRGQLSRFLELKPNVATLFIGANDVFQDVSVEVFTQNTRQLIESMLTVLPNPERLVIITIPDYSLTPAGMVYGRGRDIVDQLDAFNNAITSLADEYGLLIADIHSTSSKFVFDIGLVSEDKLHPSERGHQMWEEVIRPVVKKALRS